jgi:hypothetical protein
LVNASFVQLKLSRIVTRNLARGKIKFLLRRGSMSPLGDHMSGLRPVPMRAWRAWVDVPGLELAAVGARCIHIRVRPHTTWSGKVRREAEEVAIVVARVVPQTLERGGDVLVPDGQASFEGLEDASELGVDCGV